MINEVFEFLRNNLNLYLEARDSNQPGKVGYIVDAPGETLNFPTGQITMLLTGIEETVSISSSTPRGIDFDDPNLDEREKVIAALEQAGWVQARAARLLGMTPRQIAYRIQTLNIEVRQI